MAADEGTESEAALMAYLAQIGITVETYRHPLVFTVEEAQKHTAHLPGLHVKNMFLKDKNGQFWLVTCLDNRKIRIRDLEKKIGARKMSFGKEADLWEKLAVKPGSVTPLALYTDRHSQALHVVLDQALENADVINCHPMHNAATTALSWHDLKRFLTATGHHPVMVDFDQLEMTAQQKE